MTSLLPFIVPVLAATMGSGFFGAWLMHRRLGPKSKAEARAITAAAMDRDWSRFQREIDRLVKRVEDAEAKAEKALDELHECEAREARLRGEIVRLESIFQGEGQMRQLAQAIVSNERVEGAR